MNVKEIAKMKIKRRHVSVLNFITIKQYVN